jgi:hypothetical protein
LTLRALLELVLVLDSDAREGDGVIEEGREPDGGGRGSQRGGGGGACEWETGMGIGEREDDEEA